MLSLACPQEAPPAVEIELRAEAGPLALTRPQAPFVLVLRNNKATPIDGDLAAWLPPELATSGLPERVALGARERRELPFRIDCEPDRPVGEAKVRFVLRDCGAADAGLHVAVGRDFWRDSFEPERRRRGRPAPPEPEPGRGADAPVGARCLELDSDATLLFGRQDAPPGALAFDSDEFPFLTLWWKGPRNATLQVHVGKRVVVVPLPRAGQRPAAPWQRLVVGLDEALDKALGKKPHGVTAIEVRGAEKGAAVDDFAIVRDPLPTEGDALRALTERWAAGIAPAGLDALQRELETVDASRLARAEAVDLLLLRHGILWQEADGKLPAVKPREPVGRARLEAMLAHQHLVKESPEQLLELGWSEVRRHQALLQEAAEKIAPGKTWRDVVQALREDHPSAEELPDFARDCMDRALAFTVEQRLVTVPLAARHAVIQPVVDGPLSHTYPFGGYGGARPSPTGFTGTYLVAPPATWMTKPERELRLRGNHRSWTRVVALHEIVPGHHLQNVVHQMRPLSSFRRRFSSSTFVEGWALYCEEMMWRAGFFRDEAMRFTQLQMRLWRAARIVADVSLQTGAMTPAQAEELLVREVALDPVNSKAEVLRYLDMPSQPFTYLHGFLAIERLREEVQAREGPAFDQRRFHDRLLSFGPLPIAAIEKGIAP
jgi:hypothetical protein